MTEPESTSKLEPSIETFQVDALSVRLYDSVDWMAQDAAQLAGTYLHDVLARQERATVVLATGNSQIKFLEALIAKEGVDWSRIIFFHLDEYLGIDAGHPASFRRYLRERVQMRVKPAAFHYIEGDAIEPLDECDRYAQLLRLQPLDLCCLGLGENGHLAFNEPSVASFNDTKAVKLVKLDNLTRQQQVDRGDFSGLDAVPQYAFTLTLPTLCSAKKIFCLAPEKHKAVAVREMLKRSISTECPATVLRQQGQATLFLDLDSAGELKNITQGIPFAI